MIGYTSRHVCDKGEGTRGAGIGWRAQKGEEGD